MYYTVPGAEFTGTRDGAGGTRATRCSSTRGAWYGNRGTGVAAPRTRGTAAPGARDTAIPGERGCSGTRGAGTRGEAAGTRDTG